MKKGILLAAVLLSYNVNVASGGTDTLSVKQYTQCGTRGVITDRESKEWLKKHSSELKSGIDGTVIDDKTKLPMQDIIVFVIPDHSDRKKYPDFPSSYEVLTDREGKFSFCLPKGKYSLGSKGKKGGKEKVFLFQDKTGNLLNFNLDGDHIFNIRAPLITK